MTATTAVGFPATNAIALRYAGFTYRLTAGLVDLLILAPFFSATVFP